MGNIPANYLLLGGTSFLFVIVVMLGGAWWLIHDTPHNNRKLSWHQLVKNSFNLSLIDEKGRSWMIDILYNENITYPRYLIKGERRLHLQLPVGFKFSEFIVFVGSLEDVGEPFSSLVNGIIQESVLSSLHFTRQDLSLYHEFKRHLLIKALKH
jgi:hypothetical protein